MARLVNPVEPSKRDKPGIDGQLHGGTMEAVDQMSNAIAQTVENMTKIDEKKK